MSLASIDHLKILGWISDCNRLHPDCPPTPNQNRKPHEVPSWVIDVQDGCIVAGIGVPRYVALSYVWPATDSKDTALELKMSNLSESQEKGFLHGVKTGSLPKVISDAIELAKQLGERYIWVDRLCIVQDGEMKHTEIERMDNIYSGAYFTVIAAASLGFFEEWRRSFTMSTSPASLYAQLLESKWGTRGWTFQEQILSRRAVIFIDENVFWDCQRSIWSKDGPEHDAEVANPQDQLGHATAVAVPSTVFADFKLYREFVCLYSDRDLTYPQDALAAFSGIISSLSRTFPGGFVGGLPVLFLDAALLWQPFSKGKRRVPVQGRVHDAGLSSAHLPSWSWCGWQVIVDPWSLHARSLEWSHCKFQTKRLVQWSVMSDDLQSEQKLLEPAILEEYCARFLEASDINLPEGWSRHDIKHPSSHAIWAYSDDTFPAIDSGLPYAFTHIADATKLFSHPIPIANLDRESPVAQNWPYLCCETTTGIFKVESISRKESRTESRSPPLTGAPLKLSVDSLEKFRGGPHWKRVCRVVSLSDTSGQPAGLLRIMDDAEIKPGQDMELMAISSGSMGWDEIQASFDEAVDLFASVSYSLVIHKFERDPPLQGESQVAHQWGYLSQVDDLTQWQASRPWGKGDYHFYNVLWIERKGDIAYRRAAGRVAKEVWEANCTTKAKVILG